MIAVRTNKNISLIRNKREFYLKALSSQARQLPCREVRAA